MLSISEGLQKLGDDLVRAGAIDAEGDRIEASRTAVHHLDLAPVQVAWATDQQRAEWAGAFASYVAHYHRRGLAA